MSLLDQIGKELQEESKQQQADMHSICVGIGCDDHPVVTQPVHILLNIEGCLQQIELLIFVDDLLGETEAVQRLSS